VRSATENTPLLSRHVAENTDWRNSKHLTGTPVTFVRTRCHAAQLCLDADYATMTFAGSVLSIPKSALNHHRSMLAVTMATHQIQNLLNQPAQVRVSRTMELTFPVQMVAIYSKTVLER